MAANESEIIALPIGATSRLDAMESLVQPGRHFGISDIIEELSGELKIRDEAEVSTGYADIYRGTWTSPQGRTTEVAIKVIRQLFPKDKHTNRDTLRKRTETRVRREVFIWSRTKHPNLHPFLGYQSKPQPRLVSPWCHHGNLSEYLRGSPDLLRIDKLRLIHQAGCGLAHLHSQTPPICHGDIKPENVLINDYFEAVLSDFGLGRVLMGLGVSTGFTTSEAAPGTLRYMAQELIIGEEPRVSLQTDVYAFGGLILAVMSGKPPFSGLQGASIMLQVMNNQHPKPEDHPELSASDPLWSLMRRCWDRTPEARPEMQEVLEKLKDFIHDEQSLFVLARAETLTAPTDSIHPASHMQQHPPTNLPEGQQPEPPQMTDMTLVPSPRSNGSSVPAITSFISQPSQAILSELGEPILQENPFDRWNTFRSNVIDHDPAPEYTSVADPWNIGYTLSTQPRKSGMNSHTSRTPTATSNPPEDNTPTQSILILKSYRRQDDSLEPTNASRRNNNDPPGSRSKRRNQSEFPSDPRSIESRKVTSPSRKTSVHGRSSHKPLIPMSFEDSLNHYRTSRRLSQPLASSLFARDPEEEHRNFQDTQKGRDQPPTVSQSVPDGREYWSRGQYRGSSRAEPGHQLLGGDASMASSLSLAEPTKIYASGGSRLPISLSTEGFQVAKRPLGPLPEELVDKLRGLTQARDEGTKQAPTLDVSGKRKEREKEREESPMTSPPPTSSTTRSKGSPHPAAPSKSAL